MSMVIPESELTTTKLNPIMSNRAIAPPQIKNPLGGIVKVIRDEETKINQIAVNDAINDLNAGLTKRAYGDEKEAGFYSQRGKAAVDGMPGFSTGNEQLAEDIKNKLTHGQRKMFAKYSTPILNKSAQSSLIFLGEQTRVAKSKSLDSQVTNANNDAAKNYSAQGIKDSLESAMLAVDEISEMNGDSKETRETRIADTTSNLAYNAGLSALANNDLGSTERILRDYGDSIYPAKRKALSNAIELSRKVNEDDYILGAAQQAVDNLTDPNAPFSYNQQALKGIKNPKVRKAALAISRQNLSDEQASRKQESDRLSYKYRNYLEPDIPAGDWSRMNTGVRTFVKERTSQFNSQDNESFYATIIAMPVEQLKDLDAVEFRAKLVKNGAHIDKAGLAKVLDYKNKAVKSVDSQVAESSKEAMSTFKNRVEADNAFGDTDTDSVEYKRAYLNVKIVTQSMINKEISRRFNNSEDTTLSPLEISRITNRVLISGKMTANGWVWDSKEKINLAMISNKNLIGIIDKMEQMKYKGKPGDTYMQKLLRFAAIHYDLNELTVE
ncbi:hypothetical protein BJAS_P3969 [Bathymodiolus japonicus methanotrophic gill symbiont]|uniref:hypothetical protein n=1 Tax=Bathymodiolus japonicus methanotrophic gill symbiont TaxID=113269 RepID=UPI001B7889D3|nr:hypothetical protein [Bathymodiolus japonicus methanotrophic gill symbiont]GFO73257.1 hypothetical protein BJAS_P3969 [Bathymodiolus japonicus methanotrophic gill symbiont]